MNSKVSIVFEIEIQKYDEDGNLVDADTTTKRSIVDKEWKKFIYGMGGVEMSVAKISDMIKGANKHKDYKLNNQKNKLKKSMN